MATIGETVVPATRNVGGHEFREGNVTQSGRNKSGGGNASNPAKPREVTAPATFRPTMKRIVSTLTSNEERAKTLAEVEAVMKGPEGVGPMIRFNVAELRKLEALTGAEYDLVRPTIQAIRKELETVGNYPTEPIDYRTPARLELFTVMVKDWPEGHVHSFHSAKNLRDELSKAGFIEVSKDAKARGVKIQGTIWVLAKEYADRPEAREAFKAFDAIWTGVYAQNQKDFEADMAKAGELLVNHNKINQDDAKAGKEGRGIWNVSDSEIKDHSTGRVRSLRGGKAVFSVSNGEITVLMGIGSLHQVVAGVAGVTIPVSQIGTSELRLDSFEKDKEVWKQKRTVHSLVGRAFQAWQDTRETRERRSEENQKSRQAADQYAVELRDRATLTIETFDEKGTAGTLALTAWTAPFVVGRDPAKMYRIYSPHALLEKRADGQVRVAAFQAGQQNHERFFRRYADFQPLEQCGQLKVLVDAVRKAAARAAGQADSSVSSDETAEQSAE